MRQQHVAGDKAFVDYSGKRVPITDPATGEVRLAEIFVAVLGASSLTYAEATWTQSLPDWIGAHVGMFRFYGAAPRLSSRYPCCNGAYWLCCLRQSSWRSVGRCRDRSYNVPVGWNRHVLERPFWNQVGTTLGVGWPERM